MGEKSETLPGPAQPQIARPNNAAKVRVAIEEVAAGVEFVRSARMIRFLRYVGEQSLSEKPQLSERQLGVAVFDREPDWDPKLDPIVRIEARRLREKLLKHYSAMNTPPEIILTMPKGSYRLEYQDHAPAIAPEPTDKASESALLETSLNLPTKAAKRNLPVWKFWTISSFVVAALSAFALLTVFTHRAHLRVSEDRAIQIVEFKLSPGTEKIGDGAAVAGMLADHLRTLQADTRISWPATPVEDVWTEQAAAPWFVRIRRKLDAIAEADNIFHKPPVKISGVVKLPDAQHSDARNLEIYVRGDGLQPRTFTGDASQLQTLLAQAAEFLYAECQPAAYDVYLTEHRRFQEAITFSQRRYSRATETADRTQFLFSWAMALEDLGNAAAAADKYQTIIDIFPQSWGSYTALINTYLESGQCERALAVGEELERAAHRGSWIYAHLPAYLFRPTRPDTFYPIDELRQDYGALRLSLEAELKATSGAGIHQTAIQPTYAEALIQLHEPRQAQLELEAAKSNPNSSKTDILEVSVDLYRELKNRAALRTLLDSSRAMLTDPQQRKDLHILDEDLCPLALAYEEIGDKATADVLISTSRPSPVCLTWKAEILARRGDFSQATAVYVQATYEGPRLPMPHFNYGVFLMERGDRPQARSQFELARKFGPRWAEPLKALADLDVASGNLQAALQEFKEAALYAPKWRDLYVAWGNELLASGDRSASEEKLRLADSF